MTIPKPKHLGREYADQFADAAVVAAYRHRPPYPTQVFPVLRDLVVGTPRVVLDLGCGTATSPDHWLLWSTRLTPSTARRA